MEQETRRTNYSAGSLLSLTTKGDEDCSGGSVGTSLELTLAHNGASVDLKGGGGGGASTVFGIMHTISSIKDAIKQVPKVGLTYKLDASILRRSVIAKWGNRLNDGPNGSGPRYVAVESYFDVDVKVKLFELSFELGFGFELTVPPVVAWFDDPTFEIIVKAAVKTSAELAIEYTRRSALVKTIMRSKAETEPELTVYLEFRVMINGKGLDADAGVRGGIKAEGSFHASIQSPPDFELDAGLKPVIVYARYFVDISGL